MKEENIEVGFALERIRIDQFAMFEENYKHDETVTFSANFEFGMNPEEKRLGAFFELEFLHGEIKLIKMVVSCHFIISDQSWINLINSEGTAYVISKEFLGHFAMITIGTARGILFAKTEGTIFSSFLLRTINVDSIIKEDAVIPIEPSK